MLSENINVREASFVPDSVHAYIEQHWLKRAENQHLKPGTKKYLDTQAEFFTGAMAALCGMSENENKQPDGSCMPPKWVFGIMRGEMIAKA